MRIGLVTGVRIEQDALAPGVARHPETAVGLIVNRFDEEVNGHSIAACTPGIGKVNAALAASVLACHYDIELLAIIGTAGNIGGLERGAYVLTEAIQSDFGAQRSDGFAHYRAGTWPIGEADLNPFVSRAAGALVATDPTLATARIATGDSFIEEASHAAKLSRALDAGLVDMEAAAVAQVADRIGIDWLGVKAVSDDADDDSPDSFTENLQTASAEAAELFARLLARL